MKKQYFFCKLEGRKENLRCFYESFNFLLSKKIKKYFFEIGE